jgi:hypothetical protein
LRGQDKSAHPDLKAAGVSGRRFSPYSGDKTPLRGQDESAYNDG